MRRPSPNVPASWITPKARKGVGSAIEGRGIVAVESIAAGDALKIRRDAP